MTLENEIEAARKDIATDGYAMSVGEIMNLYRDDEIQINPAFQRLFRWDLTRKSRFIESILLGIPTPPIFVYQRDDGVWELIDGLQRLSTILEFAGMLRKADNAEQTEETSVLTGTKMLPSLQDKVWSLEDEDNTIGRDGQIAIKRARLRVEILKRESDPGAKFELFQRLNTGGAKLSEQEVRNCVAVMINSDFYDWLTQRAAFAPFQRTVCQTDAAKEKQADVELVLRFISFVHVPYDGRMDVHEYLDDALIQLANREDINWDEEQSRFENVFTTLDTALAEGAFKRWDGVAFSGKFLMSVFEVMAFGVAKNFDAIQGEADTAGFLRGKARALWGEVTFNQYSGAGIRGTTRLTNLLPFAEGYLSP